MSTATRIATITTAVLFALAFGCSGMLETEPTTDPGVDPGTDTQPDPDPDPRPDPEPTSLTVGDVQTAFNAAVLAALAPTPPAGVTVFDSRRQARLDGAVSTGEASVSFDALVLSKAPFAVLGAATVSARQQTARVIFDGTTTGQVSVDGSPLGTIAADFPALDDFAADSVFEIFGLVLDCQGLGDGQLDGIIELDGSCTVSDDAGALLGTIDIANVVIDLLNGAAQGSVTVDAAGVTAELILAGTAIDLLVDGALVGSVDLADLLAGLL